MRRLAAALLVAVLLLAAVSAGLLFRADVPRRSDDAGGSRDGIQSVYATALASAARCPPARAASSSPGRNDTVEDIAHDVGRLRGLRFRTPPKIEFMTPEELESYVADSARSEMDEIVDVEVQALQMLDLVPEGFEIEDFIDAASQQVLGLYEPESERLLVASAGELDPRGELTVAHELDHALTDSVLGFPDLDPAPERADAALAERALIEGDATLLMQHYALLEFPEDLEEILAGATTPSQQRAFEQLPYYLRRALTFPYQEGFLFACELYAGGGWDAIDAAYDAPPATTLEIVFPALYGRFEPQEPEPPNRPPSAWRRVEDLAVGAADLQWMLEAPGGRFAGNVAEAARDVSRWRGGVMRIWEGRDGLIVALSLVEGTRLAEGEGASLCDLMIRWYAATAPEAVFHIDRGPKAAWESEREAAVVDCQGDQTRLVVAPDLQLARHVGEFRQR